MATGEPALRPFYYSRHANQALRLFRGATPVANDKGLQEWGSAYVRLRWLPIPSLEVEVEQLTLALGFGDANLFIRVPCAPTEARLSLRSIGRSVAALIAKPVQMGPLEGLRGMKFHVPNFPDYHGTWISSRSGRRNWAGRATMSAGGWRITLDSVPHIKGLQDSIKRTGGYGLTHIGLLERVDGTPFSAQEGLEMLRVLDFLFSFARGAWTTCTLPVGLGDDGSARWALWDAPRVSPASPVCWFSGLHPGSLGALLPGMLSKAKDRTWWDAIKLALNWYYECNEVGGMVYTALVLQQNALELLAWTLFVEHGPLSEDFDRLPASDKIRLLLDRAHIPVAVPDGLSNLAKLARARGWEDGPRALTELRNAHVHPKKLNKLGDVPGVCYSEAWLLGLWYLELTFLWLLGYSGEYCSRLDLPMMLGKTAKVPWSTAQ